MSKINCFQCQHFYTTWNSAFPRACKAYGFKTKEIPSTFVLKTTGTECVQYKPKHHPDQKGETSISRSQIDLRL
ncbi:hypothetical protein [Halobacillus sp. BBL2006]|uniref:hypothetical protein n=1 Tax=Halobacillus sp. BBL2006 TaxID=1543706 RepID=UPI0006910745|nr:hypothetical protein [Halobacillus sp. BBL2006]